MSQYGVSREDIAIILGIEVADIERLYAAELQKGKAIANATMAKILFEQAKGGNAKAAMQWLRWKETQDG
jgi:hypothetical protein